MKLIETDIEGLLVIEPYVFSDERGFLFEAWNDSAFREAGLDLTFVQDNHSRSRKGVLRGLHFQNPVSQGKLVRVINGAVFDVAVDLREGSSTFGKWAGVELSAENKCMLWVPDGFAHGFLTLSENADFLYKCTAPYSPEFEYTLAWDDPAIGIDWPIVGLDPIISAKDSRGLTLAEVPVFS